MRKLNFFKYHGNGNDFIIFDSRESYQYNDYLQGKNHPQVRTLCDRNFGIGADGVIFLLKPLNYENDARMIIFNSDNSEAEMCGNGIRCLIQYLIDINKSKEIKKTYRIETKAGLKIGEYLDESISVKMGKPIFNRDLIPTKINKFDKGIAVSEFKYKNFSSLGYAVGMGNPHLVFFIPDLDEININELGPYFESDPLFPEKTNVHFCEIIDRNNIKVFVWERGAGKTLACGTGACAIHAAAFKLGYCNNKTSINLPGGELSINWSNNNEEVNMKGKAENVFNGNYIFNK